MTTKESIRRWFEAAGQPALAPDALDGEPATKPRNERPRERRNDDARALTIRAAARRLGVARPTLQRLIAEGRVRAVPWVGRTAGTVPVGGRVRIPAVEVERVAQEGIVPEQAGPRAEPKKGRAAPAGAALPRIRDLDY